MILVTGGSGVLGHALIEALKKSSQAFHVVSSRDVDLGDLAATTRLFAEVAPTLVYHLAARVHGLGGNRRYPAEMFTDNIRINTNVVDAAAKTGCRKIVAVSTVAIYPADASMPVETSAIWAGPPHSSEGPYGHAKRAMLVQLEACAAQYGLKYAYPIMTNIYGPNDRFDPVYGHVLPSLISKFHRSATSGETVSVWGTGAAERDFIAAADAARALMLIADGHEGPINVATGEVVSIKSAVDILAEHTGIKNIAWDSSKPDGQILRRYNIDSLLALGFKPQVDLAAGLAETYDWYARCYPNVRT